jgi:hypothetical protein
MPYPIGSHIKVSRGVYTHHGVYIGNQQVVHYTGEVGRKHNARVQVDDLSTFARGGTVEVVRYAKRLSRRAAVERALSRVGECSYDLVFNNCEHFARWCCTGDHASEQVRNATSSTAGAVGTAVATRLALGTVAATGAVAGLSGPGIMSGLAAVGGTVGAGAVGGLAVLGSLPAAIGAAAMHATLKDDETLLPEERSARKAGRVASVIGGVAGTGGAIWAVSAAGTVAGLSGPGIASGLAAIGGTVGGGMAAGVAMCAAAPAVAAVALGYGTYRVWKLLFE